MPLDVYNEQGVPVHVAAERLIRLKELKVLTGLSRTTLYRLMQEGRFPKQIKPLGTRTSAWRSSEIHAWIAARLAGKAA